MSITSYEGTHALLEDAEDALPGRTLVQLSSGKLEAARSLERFVTGAGAAYVDGAVLAYPGAVGTDELLILYSGDPKAFEATRPLLEQLGGTAMHVGEDPTDDPALRIEIDTPREWADALTTYRDVHGDSG